jgi:hypothetical protein
VIQIEASYPSDITSLLETNQRIIQAWRDKAQEIADIEHRNIKGRTPEDTGTLAGSLTESLNPNPQTIAQVYTDPEYQLAGPWHRVYAQYQEGPPLGHSTYTNAPRLYVYDILADDMDTIREWANRVAQEAKDKAEQETIDSQVTKTAEIVIPTGRGGGGKP